MYCFVSIVLFCVLFVCKCVLYYWNRVATQLQLNMSYIKMFSTRIVRGTSFEPLSKQQIYSLIKDVV